MTPLQTYSRFNSAGMAPREVEADALIKAASRLSMAMDSGGSLQLADALAHNQKLWTVIAAAVSDEKSQLPDELRANIMSLANYVFKQTMDGSKEPNAVLPRLISINREIAAGLRTAA